MAFEDTIKDLSEARYEQGFQHGRALEKLAERGRILGEIVRWQKSHEGFDTIPFKDISEIVHPSHD